jgi:arginine decarboxylase
MPFICQNTTKKTIIYFFLTGAYQETIGIMVDYRLIPQPKHILIDRDENGILATEVFQNNKLQKTFKN